MFNHIQQVCDWPAKVVQLRPECRREEQIPTGVAWPWPYTRTRRMLPFLEPYNARGQVDQFAGMEQRETKPVTDVRDGRHSPKTLPQGVKTPPKELSFEDISALISEKIRDRIRQRLPKFIGAQEEQESDAVKSEEDIKPKMSPVLVEDTREHKPVWTVTRDRPNQILKGRRVVGKFGSKCSHRGKCFHHPVLKKIRRKLIRSEKGKLEARRILLASVSGKKHGPDFKDVKNEESELYLKSGDKMKQWGSNETSLTGKTWNIVNRNMELDENKLNEDEKSAVTLKEAFDRGIGRIQEGEREERPDPGRLLAEMMVVGMKQEDNKSKATENHSQIKQNNRIYVDTNQIRGDSTW